MVTKLQGGRGQISVKGREIDDEWEALIKKAAQRAGSTVAGFIVDHTRSAAQAILKDQSVIPAALPVRLEDVAGSLIEQLATLAKMGTEQQDRLDRIERQGRRGRWRR